MNADAAKRAKIIDKVRALLSMTTENGCTEAEALTAAGMASKLMEQYDLAFGDIKSLQDERIAQQSKPFSSAERPREMHAAGIYVAPAVGEFFDCKIWRDYTEIIFFGLRDDVELAHIMLAMIRFAMDRELSVFMKSDEASTGEHPRSLASSFLRGMGHRISQRLREIKAKRSASVRAKGKNLVVVKGAIVDAAFAAQFPNLKPARPSARPKSEIAYSAGFAAGDWVNLGHKEVAASSISKVDAKPSRQNPKRRSAAASSDATIRAQTSRTIRAAQWLARQTSGFAGYAIKVCGLLGFLLSVHVFNGMLEGWMTGKPPRGFFIDYLVERQPLWAGICAASIACHIRFERLQWLDKIEALRLDATLRGATMGQVSIWSTGLHSLYFTTFTLVTYIGSKLVPQIRDQVMSQPDRPMQEQFALIWEGVPNQGQWLGEGAAWIVAGSIIAIPLFALSRFGRAKPRA